MNQKMRNRVIIHCSGGDLTKYTNILVDLVQAELALEFEPVVIDAENAYFDISKEQATALKPAPVKMQMLYTDENGMPQATTIKSVTVHELLRGEPYGD